MVQGPVVSNARHPWHHSKRSNPSGHTKIVMLCLYFSAEKNKKNATNIKCDIHK
jgi:hypothetical protein